ncbi:MAG: delta-aminolevulinic acid dehydratase [Pseudomonadota bacterium]
MNNLRSVNLLPFTLLTVTLAFPLSVRAECGCLWEGPFADVQAGADLVVAGEVVSAVGNSIDLELGRVLRGEPNPVVTRVWLKTDDYCRPEPDNFPVGSQWVMALSLINKEVPGGFNPHTPNVSYGRLGDYSLSSCGGYWLKLQDGRVSGNLVEGARWDYQPDMTPVLLELVTGYVDGKLPRATLVEASREDPALRELMLDTREFLRQQD